MNGAGSLFVGCSCLPPSENGGRMARRIPRVHCCISEDAAESLFRFSAGHGQSTFSLANTMSQITDSLLKRARDGDQSAYDALFALHRDRALFFIRAKLGPAMREKVESQDVLQESYLMAVRDFKDFAGKDERAFQGWLYRIIENRLNDLGGFFAADKRQPVPIPASPPTGPFTAANRVEHREKVSQALDTLSEDHREVLIHRFFMGLSAEETGELMGRSAGAVRKLSARALLELEKQL